MTEHGQKMVEKYGRNPPNCSTDGWREQTLILCKELVIAERMAVADGREDAILYLNMIMENSGIVRENNAWYLNMSNGLKTFIAR